MYTIKSSVFTSSQASKGFRRLTRSIAYALESRYRPVAALNILVSAGFAQADCLYALFLRFRQLGLIDRLTLRRSPHDAHNRRLPIRRKARKEAQKIALARGKGLVIVGHRVILLYGATIFRCTAHFIRICQFAPRLITAVLKRSRNANTADLRQTRKNAVSTIECAARMKAARE